MKQKLNKKLSIICTTFNSEKTLQRTIDSIKNQTFQDFEFWMRGNCRYCHLNMLDFVDFGLSSGLLGTGFETLLSPAECPRIWNPEP